jgi:iron complex outermembrane recepter protein
VLVNGRRLMPGDPTQNGNSAPDLNQIPATLVQRVDVLTGGASATYGADAVAGAVNFVLNDHFEGVRLEGTYAFYNHNNNETSLQDLNTAYGYTAPTGSVNDGYQRDFNLTAGANFADGKGNATVYFGYRRIDAVSQGNRAFSHCGLSTSGGNVSCGGSATAAKGFFNLPTGFYTVQGNQLVPATFGGPGNSLYNFAPLNYYQRPDERYTAGAFLHYDVNPHAQVYTEFMFMDDRTIAQIAESGAFYISGTGTTDGVPDGSWEVNCNNPLLSAQEYTTIGCTGPAAGNTTLEHLIFGRRNVEGGPRYDDLGHTSFRMVAGVKGDINDTWTYDIYGQNGITRLSEEYFNDVSRARITNALQVVTNPAFGQPGQAQYICAANAGAQVTAPGCVPWNIWQTGGVTPAATDYLSVPGLSKGETQEIVVDGSVTGDLGKAGIKLPTAHDGLAINVGFEYRQETEQLQPDLEYITNDLAGQGAPTLPTNGQFHVWEGFTELRVPILQDEPFAKSLTLDGAYRYSDYNLSFGATNTYRIGLEWAPVSDARARLSYNRAVRAPNAQELFLQDRVQLDGTNDQCAGAAPSATLAQCERSGVIAAEYGNIPKDPANQYNGLVGGNTNLQPERADTYTAGIVLTPTAVPNFNATIDYYYIKINNFVTTYGANFVLTQCLDSGDPFFCNKVHRIPYVPGLASSGALFGSPSGYIEDQTYNLGYQLASGIDVTLSYRLDMRRAGSLDFNFTGNYVTKFTTEPVPGFGAYDCVGYYGATCGVPVPHWKHVLRTTWHTPAQGLDGWVTWRRINSVNNEHTSPNPLLSGPTSPFAASPDLGTQPGTRLQGVDYIDLGVSYAIKSNVTLRAGCNNLFDRDPPLSSLYYLPTVLGNGNTMPQVYDTMGRYIFASLQLDF